MIKICSNFKSVTGTTDRHLCVSCGLCKIICPVVAISMELERGQFIPKVDSSKCIECEKCLNVCPGIEVNYQGLYEYRRWDYPENILFGNKGDSFIAYTENKKIRNLASSGGFISTLLIELIESGEYEGAFVVDDDAFRGQEVKLRFVTKKEDILSAAKSKYMPVSIENVGIFLKDNPDKKIIVVATSCHVHGILKYLKENSLSHENILFIGLFCEKTLNFNLFSYYQNCYAQNNEKIETLYYRSKEDEGWPGNTKIIFNSGRSIFVNRQVRMKIKRYFQLERCLYCIDKTNQFADISCGDCYIAGEESKLGKSNVVVRSEKGKHAFAIIVEKMKSEKVSFSKIIGSQKVPEKKINLWFDQVNSEARINCLSGEENMLFPKKTDAKIRKKLKKRKKRINMGRYYNKNKLKIWFKSGQFELKKLITFFKEKIEHKFWF